MKIDGIVINVMAVKNVWFVFMPFIQLILVKFADLGEGSDEEKVILTLYECSSFLL